MNSSSLAACRLLPALAALLLAACGGSGDGSKQGEMKLSVGDAPVDGAQKVVLVVTGVELTPDTGSVVTINFTAPKAIDLLKDSGTAAAVLFDQKLATGRYTQVRLVVTADGNASNSYIVTSDGNTHGLLVPSGAETGFKLVQGFSVNSSGIADYAIDFDLRKSVTCPPGQAPACLLKPTTRLVDNAAVGDIQGSVAGARVVTGCVPAVYLYSGTVTTPADMDSTAGATDPNQPLSSRAVYAAITPPYAYQFSFLEPGSYTLALTCKADQDNPDQPDTAVTFAPVITAITVTAGQATTADIP
jgi:hypothetical protein